MSNSLNKALIVLLLNLIIFLSLVLGALLWYDWPNNDPQITQQEHSDTNLQTPSTPSAHVMPASTTIATETSTHFITTSRITPTISPTPSTSTPAPIPLSTTPTGFNPIPPAITAPARIIASTINLDSSVTEMGWALKEDEEGNSFSDWVVPEFAAGWHINSMLPGHGGNTVLSAHHNIGAEVFRDLIQLEAGDHVAIEAGNLRYDYTVEEKYIVKEEGVPEEIRRANNRYIEPTSDERLTLVSCWPYESNSHRIIVIARPAKE